MQRGNCPPANSIYFYSYFKFLPFIRESTPGTIIISRYGVFFRAVKSKKNIEKCINVVYTHIVRKEAITYETKNHQMERK